jgi:hypothetical protein
MQPGFYFRNTSQRMTKGACQQGIDALRHGTGSSNCLMQQE